MNALDVPALFSAPGEGETTWFQPNRMTVKATAETTGGAFGLVESFIPAGSSPPFHVHHREDESFWVLQGRSRAARAPSSSCRVTFRTRSSSRATRTRTCSRC